MSKDIQFQIECLSTEIINLLIEEYGWDIKRALEELYSSETFAKLNDPECGLYYESAVYREVLPWVCIAGIASA